MKAGKPLVLHNGLIDLIFMYHNLWTALPPKLDTFISDVSQMFPAGVYDTKYVADYVARTQVDFVIPYKYFVCSCYGKFNHFTHYLHVLGQLSGVCVSKRVES